MGAGPTQVSAYSTLIDTEARDAFPGRFTHLRIERYPDRCVAILEDQVTRETLAIGSGADHGRACTMLLTRLQSHEYDLSSEETAAILGTSLRAIRDRVHRGTLRPLTRHLGPGGNTYSPAEVGRVMAGRLPDG